MSLVRIFILPTLFQLNITHTLTKTYTKLQENTLYPFFCCLSVQNTVLFLSNSGRLGNFVLGSKKLIHIIFLCCYRAFDLTF